MVAPRNIYRFRGFTGSDLADANKRNRLSKEIKEAEASRTWFSKVAEQNDPFDTNPFFVDSSIREVKVFMEEFRRIAGKYASFNSSDFVREAVERGMKVAHAKKHLKNYTLHIRTVRETFEHHRDNGLISAFSSDPENILLWSYYAQSHSSFCYEFSLPNDMRDLGNRAVADVRYTSERPKITTIDMMRQMASVRFPDHFHFSDERDIERVDNAVFLCKSIHWMHEKEWRSLRPPQKPGYFSIYPYELTSIIFGVNASSEITEFTKNCLTSNAALKKCRLNGERYEIEIKPA